jgi:tRNA-splicing ligase RtcB (3'-phosphate/5'-hydroxy nucleic acid ligase)
MKILHRENSKVPIKAWIDHIQLEESAENQLYNLAQMPFIYKHVAVMPDAHWGMGSTVGSVIATQGAIIPAAVGVDIGCGMSAVKLKCKIDAFDRIAMLRSSIERSIPVGFNINKELTHRMWSSIKTTYADGTTVKEKTYLQLGTLGGGNHFIEICYDQNNDAWIMLHSGSRNIGKTSAEKHIENAKGLMRDYFISLPDPDLAYLVQGTKEFDAYIADLLWAQEYAKQNRNEMMLRVLKDVSYNLYGAVNRYDHLVEMRVDCHHNFTQLENHFDKNIWITRKGAVSAREGQLGIIPGSMGTGSFIVKGKGNPESFCSCSHGAGRAMSRNAARKLFTVEDHAKATKGVECRKDADVIDETPMAYKNIHDVMASQSDLVEILYSLKQVLCIKG